MLFKPPLLNIIWRVIQDFLRAFFRFQAPPTPKIAILPGSLVVTHYIDQTRGSLSLVTCCVEFVGYCYPAWQLLLFMLIKLFVKLAVLNKFATTFVARRLGLNGMPYSQKPKIISGVQ